jgi:hypothetical protein
MTGHSRIRGGGDAAGFEVSQEPDRWAKVPYWLLTAVSPNAVVVYAALGRYVNMPDGCRPSVDLLAADLDCSVRKVQRGIAELITAGAITVEDRFKANGQQDTSRYHLHVSGPHGRRAGGDKNGTPKKKPSSRGDDTSDTPNRTDSEKPSSQGVTDSTPSPEGGDRFVAKGVTDMSPEIDTGEIDRGGLLRHRGTSLGDVPDEQTPPSQSASTLTKSRDGSAATARTIAAAYRRLDRTIMGGLRSRERDRARKLLEDGLSVEDARAALVSERKSVKARSRDELATVGEGRS